MNNPVKDAQKAHIRACLEGAIAVWEYMSQVSLDAVETADTEEVVLVFERGAIYDVLAPHFPKFERTDKREGDVMAALGRTHDYYGGLTSCGLFSFAHQLDHIFDLEEFDSIAEH